MRSADTPVPHILLVEDEVFLRELVAEYLVDAGFKVSSVGDGASGLETLQSDLRIDVLLSDIKLPDMDGYRVAEAASALRPGLKVILMTGYAPSPLPSTLHSVVYQILQKPFSLESLAATVAGAMGS
jgi:DNA-binding NtrC family response regulator